MNLYNIADLHTYYRGSWIRHPETGAVIQCQGAAGNGSDGLSFIGAKKDAFVLDKKQIEWEHVRCPELGYRTSPCGGYVLHLSKIAARGTAKGFNRNTIRASIPQACVDYYNTVLRMPLPVPALDQKIAEQAFHPTFVRLDEAVIRLAEDPKATGFALSSSWAVTLGMYEGCEYQLFLKGVHVAVSPNGKDWEWLDDTAQELFAISSVR